MSSNDPRVLAIWPNPPARHTYVRQTLPGGEYISTGYFPSRSVDGAGRGRTFANCAAVTSLFFDCDVLSLYDAARRAKGAILEVRVLDRKAKLYGERPEIQQGFSDLLYSEFIPHIEAVIGVPPSLVVSSGWGYHVHYALHPEVAGEKQALQLVMQGCIAEANRLCLETARGFEPRLQVTNAFDNTHDVGTRLARYPGTQNTKARGNPRPVSVVASSQTILTRADLLRLQNVYCQDLLAQGDSNRKGRGKVPKPKRPKQARSMDVDFRSMTLPDGRGWQSVADGLGPGERLKVICPFGGSTVGSGFFAKDRVGKVRYYSSPTATTYWNTHVTVRTSALAELVRGPGKNGQPGAYLKNMSNLARLLEDDTTFDYWYDAFSEREMDGQEPVTDTAWMQVRLHMEGVYGWYWNVGRETLWSMVELVARRRARNPVAEWLKALRWDGVHRLDRWLITAAGAPDSLLTRAYARRWGIGLVSRVMRPGEKLDTCLVLSAKQGYGKSRLFRAWVDIPGLGELFCDTRVDLKDKDAFQVLYQCWLYEDAELGSTTSANAETKKAFLSSCIDRFRPPFGRKVRTYRRHTVVVGTTNDINILRDKTGGTRRFWVVGLPDNKEADIDWLEANRAQLFAEALHYYREGEQWWLTRDEERMRQLSNRQYQWLDWYTECAVVAFGANGGGVKHNRFTVGDFAHAIGKTVCPQARGLSLSSALIRAGFRKRRVSGINFYYKPCEQAFVNDGLSAVTSLIREANQGARSALDIDSLDIASLDTTYHLDPDTNTTPTDTDE